MGPIGRATVPLLLAVVFVASASVAGATSAGYPGTPLPPSPVAGELDEEDLHDGSLADYYSVDLQAGDRIRVSLNAPIEDRRADGMGASARE
jgi:hypothetical protein